MESDETLVERSRRGDAGAFKDLITRHEARVAGVAKSMLGDTPEAEDVGQEVFIRFYKALGHFKGESMVSTYLIRIAINLCLNELKKRKRWNKVFTREEEGFRVSAGDDQYDIREMVSFELKKLSPEYQSVITLRMMEGYSTEETSKILNIPLGTVLSRLARAQQKLRQSLQKYQS